MILSRDASGAKIPWIRCRGRCSDGGSTPEENTSFPRGNLCYSKFRMVWGCPSRRRIGKAGGSRLGGARDLGGTLLGHPIETFFGVLAPLGTAEIEGWVAHLAPAARTDAHRLVLPDLDFPAAAPAADGPDIFGRPVALVLTGAPHRFQAAEKGPSAALARRVPIPQDGCGAAAYVCTPRTPRRWPPCSWTFLSSLGKFQFLTIVCAFHSSPRQIRLANTATSSDAYTCLMQASKSTSASGLHSSSPQW